MQRIVRRAPFNHLTPKNSTFLDDRYIFLNALKVDKGTGRGGYFYAVTVRRRVKGLYGNHKQVPTII